MEREFNRGPQRNPFRIMKRPKHRVELLAPAGSYEKLVMAIHYGADAVYLGGKEFSLRSFSGNFTVEELHEAIDYAHAHGVKVYLAVNSFSRNHEQAGIMDYLDQVAEMKPDALIIADPGVLMSAKKRLPGLPIHLSTQANTTNFNSALFWQSLGVKRINVARELSLKEIREIADHCTIEIEAFVHGAMCISYSGRCLLSSFMTRRDSNRGLCSHPCRWRYAVMEETRPGKYFPIVEDGGYSYIFNSSDLCMLAHIPEMVTAGIDSLKIEGRMKGINYLASVVKVYREAIDAYSENPDTYHVKKEWLAELSRISHRTYCTGFYLGDPDQVAANFDNMSPPTVQTFLGKLGQTLGNRRMQLDTRNKIFAGEPVEILPAKGPARPDRILSIFDDTGRVIPFAQPNQMVTVSLEQDHSQNDLVRRDSIEEHLL
jgi:U32 family peptidase